MSKILDLAKSFEQKSLEELQNTNQSVQSALEKHEQDITTCLEESARNISNAIEQTSESLKSITKRLPEQNQELIQALSQTQKQMQEHQAAWMMKIQQTEQEQAQALRMQKEEFNKRLEESVLVMLQKQDQALEEVEIAAKNLLRRLFRPYWRGLILLGVVAASLLLVVTFMGLKINSKAEQIQLMNQKIENLKNQGGGIQLSTCKAKSGKDLVCVAIDNNMQEIWGANGEYRAILQKD